MCAEESGCCSEYGGNGSLWGETGIKRRPGGPAPGSRNGSEGKQEERVCGGERMLR